MNETSPKKNGKLNIQLMIGNKMQQITVGVDQEGTFRAAAKKINQTLGKYRQAYPDLSYDSCISLTLIDLAVYSLQAENAMDTTPYDNAVKTLTEEVEEALGIPQNEAESPKK